jgi:enamine deaminase RidA (YjgF/YER057c/UK114 family)
MQKRGGVRCVPAAMTVGMLLDVLFLAGCVMDDPDESEIVSQRLRTQLNHLLALCDALLTAKDPSS